MPSPFRDVSHVKKQVLLKESFDKLVMFIFFWYNNIVALPRGVYDYLTVKKE